MIEQARMVLDHYRREGPPARTVHFNFMARGEPLASRVLLADADRLLGELSRLAAGPGLRPNRIEALLSARLFVEPQLAGERVYFVSNLSGHLSLYSMEVGGGVPVPLLPPRIALQNPELLGGHLFQVLPELDRILVMIDHDGDENYEPFLISLDGGFPEPLADQFGERRSHLVDVDDATAYP